MCLLYSRLAKDTNYSPLDHQTAEEHFPPEASSKTACEETILHL